MSQEASSHRGEPGRLGLVAGAAAALEGHM